MFVFWWFGCFSKAKTATRPSRLSPVFVFSRWHRFLLERSGIGARRGEHGVGRSGHGRRFWHATQSGRARGSHGAHLTREQGTEGACSKKGHVGAVHQQDAGGQGRRGQEERGQSTSRQGQVQANMVQAVGALGPLNADR